MYFLLIQVLFSAHLCFARPASHEPKQSLRDLHLPTILLSLPDTTTNLTLPIPPGPYPELESTIVTAPGIPPRGIQLVLSIAFEILNLWFDTTNQRIVRIFHHRVESTGIELFAEPNLQPEAALTPLKVGLVCRQMLERAFLAQSWPGLIKATVWDAVPGGERHALKVGTILIKYSPLHLTSNVSSRRNATSLDGEPRGSTADLSNHTLSFGIPSAVERRWLHCWTAGFMYAMRFSPGDIVRDNMGAHGIPPQQTLFVQFRCPESAGDRFALKLLAAPRDGGPPLTFKVLTKAMMMWIIQVANDADEWRKPRVIQDELSSAYGNMFVRLAAGGPADVVATA